jgi:hypothetical protein
MKTLLNRPDDGRFIPSQVASNEEYLALANTMAEFGIGSIGIYQIKGRKILRLNFG